jgi:hypothetical protein
MDSNRIPAPLRKHLDEGARQAQLSDTATRLTFADWVSRRGNDLTDGWIVVGHSVGSGDEHRLTTSFLIPASEESEYLEAGIGSVSVEDGASAVIDDYVGTARDKQRDPSPLNPGARPFVLHRWHYGYAPARLELVQAFELYWNGWWEGGALRWIDVDGEIRELARVRTEGDQRILEVDAHHLRAFLTVNESVLLRNHTHMRFSAETLAGRIETTHRDDSARFEIVADNNRHALGSDTAAIGQIDGRDVVRGYEKLEGDPRVPKQRYETFVVDRSASGHLREASADPDVTSSYFKDTGNDHFLTQVFFRAGVLARYYSDPRRFRVEDEHVWCLELWNIRFERSTDDLIWAYLDDLGRLPYAEQRYWRTFNEVAAESVSPERFAQDFMAQWTARAPDPVYDFLRGIEAVNAAACAAFGQVLVRPLNASDEHVRTGLRIPLNESPEEADTQLTAMAKMIVEAPDTGLLRSLVPKGFDVKNKSSLKLLEGVLGGWISQDDVDAIMTPLFNLYYLRSTGSAHYRGSRWEETLERSGLTGLNSRDMVREALRQAATALVALQRAIAARAPATAAPAPGDGTTATP